MKKEDLLQETKEQLIVRLEVITRYEMGLSFMCIVLSILLIWQVLT
jgi:hypothetical protein